MPIICANIKPIIAINSAEETLTFCEKEISECGEVSKLSVVRQKWAKRRNTLCRVDDQVVCLCLVIVRHQRKDVIKVRLHEAGVKVHDDGSVCILWVSVIVHVYDDHNVVANVTLPFQLENNMKNIIIAVVVALLGDVN